MQRSLVRRALLAMGCLVLGACGDDGDDGATLTDTVNLTDTVELEDDAGAGAASEGASGVAALLAAEASGPVRARGYLVAEQGVTRLCETLAESSPPGCGEPSLTVEGMTAEMLAELDGVVLLDTVTYTETQVVLQGVLVGGILAVTP
jgi:hypothetical protein